MPDPAQKARDVFRASFPDETTRSDHYRKLAKRRVAKQRTDTELADAVRQLVERTRREQGLPETVTDVAVLDRIAAHLAAGVPDAP